jgi:hypothetical protein
MSTSPGNGTPRNGDLDELITSLNRFLRGWANYFRQGVSKATFNAFRAFCTEVREGVV